MGGFYILVGHQFSPKTEKRENGGLFLCFRLYRLSNKVLFLWIWVVSQAPFIIVVRLGMSGCNVGSCMVGTIKHLERIVYSKGDNSPNKNEKEGYTKWSFWIQILGLIWLLVIVDLLDRETEDLGCKELAQLKL